MENAGRGVEDVMLRLGIAGPVAVCCGKGNNGGDGFVIARHLGLNGYEARVLVWGNEAEMTADTKSNYDTARRAGLPIEMFGNDVDVVRLRKTISDCDWIVDALLGTGTKGAPRPPLDDVIRTLNEASGRKLAVDVPSGLDADTGCPAKPTFIARHTCTFVARKKGFAVRESRPFLGEVHVVDIGAPRQLVNDVLASN
jgi:NAD(P)H-hydrate epimerase